VWTREDRLTPSKCWCSTKTGRQAACSCLRVVLTPRVLQLHPAYIGGDQYAGQRIGRSGGTIGSSSRPRTVLTSIVKTESHVINLMSGQSWADGGWADGQPAILELCSMLRASHVSRAACRRMPISLSRASQQLLASFGGGELLGSNKQTQQATLCGFSAVSQTEFKPVCSGFIHIKPFKTRNKHKQTVV
jgi:hypothetical protein